MISPEDFGLARCHKEDLRGGTPARNAEITRSIIEGKERGPMRSAVLLNAGAALVIGGKAETMAEGILLAGKILDDGSAAAALEKMIEVSNR